MVHDRAFTVISKSRKGTEPVDLVLQRAYCVVPEQHSCTARYAIEALSLTNFGCHHIGHTDGKRMILHLLDMADRINPTAVHADSTFAVRSTRSRPTARGHRPSSGVPSRWLGAGGPVWCFLWRKVARWRSPRRR